MGRCLVIVNPDKRQFVSPHSFEESAKCSSYMEGITANAVALLACKPTDVFHTYGELAGSWFGDRIIAAGDDYCPPNQDGITTATDDIPSRNLYFMARDEFEDISLDVMLMMCRGSNWFAERFAKHAKNCDTQLFIKLAGAAIEEHNESMQLAIERVNGPAWRNKYRRACEKYDIEPRT